MRKKKRAAKLWGGRFQGETDPVFAGFQSSIHVDHRMLFDDIFGSKAWATALQRARVLTPAEEKRIHRGLDTVIDGFSRRVAGGKVITQPTEFPPGTEDVHSFVEQKLTTHIGDLAKKLHTGRSRNDQVALDLKQYVANQASMMQGPLFELMCAMVLLADRYADTPMPGYTHLQRAQPITIGHHCLAYVEMLARDEARVDNAMARSRTCPLGSGALAGTAFPIDRARLAKELGFPGGPTRNSLDAVSDRDHACELAFACSMVMLHLSRLAEDWIFFASHEARFLHLSDAVSTGSSLMPQKKNPDALELIRGQTGRVFGDLHTLLVMLKGLPLAYDKDMQEDKRAVFDALATTEMALRVMTIVAKNVTFDVARCRAEASRGYLNATDLADLLVKQGVPFRTAHERVGVAVRRAMELSCELEDLPPAERKRLLPELKGDLKKLLSVDAVLARRDVIGGTAPRRVRQEIARWKKLLAK